MSKRTFRRIIGGAVEVATRQNCAQVVMVSLGGKRVIVEALTVANRLLAFAIAWPDGRIQICGRGKSPC